MNMPVKFVFIENDVDPFATVSKALMTTPSNSHSTWSLSAGAPMFGSVKFAPKSMAEPSSTVTSGAG